MKRVPRTGVGFLGQSGLCIRYSLGSATKALHIGAPGRALWRGVQAQVAGTSVHLSALTLNKAEQTGLRGELYCHDPLSSYQLCSSGVILQVSSGGWMLRSHLVPSKASHAKDSTPGQVARGEGTSTDNWLRT